VAPPTGTLRVGRYFAALLAILAVLYAIVFWPGARHTPKLGIDLAGGTEVIFKAKTEHGGTPSSSSMNTAKQIITNRVNGTGVTESTVVIQGNDEIVVSIPGKQDEQASQLGKAAVLNLRALVAPGAQVTCTPKSAAKPSTSTSSSPPASKPTGSTTPTTAGSSPTSSHSGAVADSRPLGKATPSSTPTTTPASTASTTPTSSGTKPATTPTATPTAPAAIPCEADPLTAVAKAGKFTVPLNDVDYNKLSASNQQLIAAALANFDCNAGQNEVDSPKSYFIACDGSGIAYLLSPVVVAGRQISTASAQAPNGGQGGTLAWTVNLTLTDSGLKAWAKYTSAHNFGSQNIQAAYTCSFAVARCANYVGFTLDGYVISLPGNESTINTNPTQITGSFTASSAKELANQLKYGALPLSFSLQSSEPVSATLGSSQLKAGLLAGGIGLILVVLYSLIYYRALGLVTIASLLVSGALTYGALVMLATQIDFTLSLAGIAGFIVAVGITADSFVVFFERMKDEVHEGRSARVAIPRAWVRARRTILSADTVSFLAAAILYYFAAGDVRGFAFTLGLSTILDLVVVFLFTHPLISFLSRFQSFGSARFTGLDAVRGGPAISEAASAERGKPGAKAAKPTAAPASVAVLDDESEVDVETAADVYSADVDVETAIDSEPQADADTVERRSTTPEPGSAAERAAARRARMREQGNTEKGDS